MRSVRRALAALAIASLAAALLPQGAQAQSRAPLVRLPIPAYDGTLTPYTFESGYPLMTLVYDTLMWRNARGQPRPWLAQSVQRSQGGRRITIRLRDGVRWHDGRPLTASDVAFTFDFMTQRFHPRFTPQLENVERTTAGDPLTVTIELRRRSLGFDDQPLSDVPILPRHLWEGLPQGRVSPPGRPVGSGPYRVTSADRRQGYGFRANRAYFIGRPAVDRIRVPIIREEGRTYRALQRRQVDMLPVRLPERPAARLERATGISVDRGPSYSGTSLLFNLRGPPFDRRAVRRAVASALDLERVLRNIGPGVPADHGYIHPSSPWASERALQRSDVPAARRALSRLDLPPIRILAPSNDPLRVEAGRQVGLALRRAGADATVVEVSRASLGRAIGEDGSTADFEAAIISTPPLASYDPDFLGAIFGADPRDAPLNYSGYRSGAFEALAERTESAGSRAARLRAVGAELRLLARDVPEVPLFFPEGAFGFRQGVYGGWVFIRGTGILDKRSFLTGQGRPSSQRNMSADDDGGEDSDDGTSFLDVLSILSLVALLVVVVLAVLALLNRRRTGRS